MIEMGGGKRFIATKLYIFLMVTNGMSPESYAGNDRSESHMHVNSMDYQIHQSLKAPKQRA